MRLEEGRRASMVFSSLPRWRQGILLQLQSRQLQYIAKTRFLRRAASDKRRLRVGARFISWRCSLFSLKKRAALVSICCRHQNTLYGVPNTVAALSTSCFVCMKVRSTEYRFLKSQYSFKAEILSLTRIELSTTRSLSIVDGCFQPRTKTSYRIHVTIRGNTMPSPNYQV
jgi:hypothetical protein